MAFDALAHAPDFGRQALLILNLAMTFLAGDFFVYVALMVEKNVLGHIVDFIPRYRRAGIEITVLLAYPRMGGNYIVMAMQAFFHRGNTGKIRIRHIGVAVLALNLLDSAVNIVAERYGLFGPFGIE